MAQKGIVYPTGVRELSDDLTTDELVRRLKVRILLLSYYIQTDEADQYKIKALDLAVFG